MRVFEMPVCRLAVAALFCAGIFSQPVKGQSATSPAPAAGQASAAADDAVPPALKDLGYDHISISVEDLDKEIAWYTHVLGFKETNRRQTPTFLNVNLRNANTRIDLIKFPGSKRTPADPVYMNQGWAHLGMNVPDLATAKAAFVAMGVDVKGTGVLVLKDPEGNEIEIFARK